LLLLKEMGVKNAMMETAVQDVAPQEEFFRAETRFKYFKSMQKAFEMHS
jgi:hypothetical protein